MVVELDSRRGKEAMLQAISVSASWVSMVEGMLGRTNLLQFSEKLLFPCPLTASKCSVRNRTDHNKKK